MKKYAFLPAILILLLQFLATNVHALHAREGLQFSGFVFELETREPIPFANVALFDSTGTNLLTGGISNMEGEFCIELKTPDPLKVRISAVGYETLYKNIYLKNQEDMNPQEYFLTIEEITLEGIVVIGERIRANTGAEQTTYYINKNMVDASNTGTDILKLIPGVSLDIRQNLSLEGSQNILILVDGKKRDRNYLSRLHAGQIDKVEVIANPSARYDAEITGVLNIVLVKERDAGLDGHVYLEVPGSGSETYLFPNYSLHYGFRNLNLFTSYDGEFSYFDIEESTQRQIPGGQKSFDLTSVQQVRQENWSHRFHYGFDYFMNERNQLNFYAWYNPFSQEHSGQAHTRLNGSDKNHWFAEKEDNDKNRAGYYSLFYRHLFEQESGHELSMEAAFYNLKAEHSTIFSNEETGYFLNNSMSPRHQSLNMKIDYSRPLSATMALNTGLQSRIQEMGDAGNDEFSYNSRIFAAYATFSAGISSLEASMGLRAENFLSENNDGNQREDLILLPGFSLNFRMSGSRNLRFFWRQRVSYPGVYQLNPVSFVEDPYSLNSGNPGLNPAFHRNLNLEYTKRFENSYISTQLFYNKSMDVINNLTWINHEGNFETRRFNLGDIHQFGAGFSGALSFSRRIGINPYLRLFSQYLKPGELALEHHIRNGYEFGFESGFAAYAGFNRDITASVLFQYASPMHHIQGNSFSGAMYFLSLEKSFAKGFKAGVVSGLPLAGAFTYHGSEVQASEFYSRSEGNIQMSTIPFWFKFTWQFSSGNKRSRIERQPENTGERRSKGF